ncbi:MAG: NAD(P)/FAD-dependent oxidoreductase [Ruthenibacterium sp.]
MYEVAIIGCGVIGAATAYALARYDVSAVVLEAENDVADGTTKANSAILHAGYDPEPGTQMAELNVRGSAQAKKICAALDVPYRQCGSLVLAFTDAEIPHLKKLYENGVANGVPDLQLLSGDEARAMEPQLSAGVKAALCAPSAAIVSPWEYALAMAETAVKNGVELRLDSAVQSISQNADGSYTLQTATGAVQAKRVVNAAGVFADKVHDMAAAHAFTIEPSRGEYYLLDKSEGACVSHVVFQCPTAVGKGVLVAPTVHGNLIVGPNAEPVCGDDTATTAQGLAIVAQAAQKSVPTLALRASIRNFAGVRAAADREDFIIEFGAPHFLDLAGIKSPGLSAAAAIGETAVQMLAEDGLALPKRPQFENTRRRVHFKELTAAQKTALVKEQPAYGRVVCRCETITEGEILDAIHSPIPPCSLDGVKRRAGAGMGRCQGGFCGPRVLELLARELHRDPMEIVQDKAGTVLLTGRTKQARRPQADAPRAQSTGGKQGKGGNAG